MSFNQLKHLASSQCSDCGRQSQVCHWRSLGLLVKHSNVSLYRRVIYCLLVYDLTRKVFILECLVMVAILPVFLRIAVSGLELPPFFLVVKKGNSKICELGNLYWFWLPLIMCLSFSISSPTEDMILFLPCGRKMKKGACFSLCLSTYFSAIAVGYNGLMLI